MKHDLKITRYTKAFRQLVMQAGMLVLTLFFVNGLFAQKDTVPAAKAPADSTAPAPAAEEPSLISPSIQFVCVQKGDNTIDLKAVLQTKIKGSFIKLAQLKIKFVAVEGTEERDLGFAITNGQGKIVYNVKADSLKLDAEGKLHLKAIFAGNKAMEAAEEEVAVKKARLEITPVKEDSLLTVKVKLVDLSTGAETPVKEVTVGVFVNRSFNALKLGEGTTDENGEITVEIPNNLPGDPKGNITLLGRLDENELYGNLEAASVQKWGIPVSDKITEQPRELWSPHPPIWMLITFIILMGTVWGHYIVIVVQLFRLRKEEPHDQPITSA